MRWNGHGFCGAGGCWERQLRSPCVPAKALGVTVNQAVSRPEGPPGLPRVHGVTCVLDFSSKGLSSEPPLPGTTSLEP